MIKITFPLFLMLLAPTVAFSSGNRIAPDDARISIRGLNYPSMDADSMTLNRFRADILATPSYKLGINPDKARNSSGGILSFSTSSPTVMAHFKVVKANYMGTGFGVFENGTLLKEYKYNARESEIHVRITSGSEGLSLFEIMLPSFAQVEFLGLTLDEGASLKKPDIPVRPVYVALGDSISHGTGQDGYGHKTWPFLLSRSLGMDLFNLAVGGGKVSVPVGTMLEDWDHIDLITILVGYNGLHFNQKTPDQYRNDYADLLDAIRANHPDTLITCISLLHTKKPVSAKTGTTADQFRRALQELIHERSKDDPNLLFIPGDTISSEANLRQDKPQDPVHLGIEGAAMLAEELEGHLLDRLNSKSR
jgi:lysophospholipase L1-like esterase